MCLHNFYLHLIKFFKTSLNVIDKTPLYVTNHPIIAPFRKRYQTIKNSQRFLAKIEDARSM